MSSQVTSDHDFKSLLEEMGDSIAAARVVIQNLNKKKDASSESLNTKDGISLLSMKNHLLLSYLQSLTLLTPLKLLGESLTNRSPPSLPFSNPNREARGSDAGDLVDSMVEGRLVLEKVKILEERLRYQIDKLVHLAKEDQNAPVDETLAFKPNPANFADDDESDAGSDAGYNGGAAPESEPEDGIYRPPRIAAVPYTGTAGKKTKGRREAIPQTLAALRYHDASMPHIETTSGLGSMPSLQSRRARELKEMQDYEEENFTRLVLGKKESKQRARDEADVALGGGGELNGVNGRRRRGAGGLEDEFGDVLRSVDRVPKRGTADGYDDLRQRGKRKAVLERSRGAGDEPAEAPESKYEGKKRKRSRFEAEQGLVKRKLARNKSSGSGA